VTRENSSLSAAAKPPGQRDAAIDILRGIALITITINHITGFTDRMGMKGMQFPTLTLWGFSSAAEIFFLLSGYLVGAVYFSRAKQPTIASFADKVWRRAARLYVYNLGLFILLIPLALYSDPLSRLSFYLYFFQHEPWSYLQFLVLYIQPYCLEILVTYMVLLASAPIFALMLRLQPILAVLASIGLYWFAHETPWFNIPGGSPLGDWRWNFNPASWQLLFFVAMAAGRYRLLEWLRSATRGNWWLLGAAWTLFAALTILFLAQRWYGFEVLFQSKVRIGPVRAAHALSVSWAIMSLFWMWPRLQRFWPARQCAVIGANSLQAFVACVAISYAAGFLWIEYARDHTTYVLLCVASVILLGLFANFYIWWKRHGLGHMFRIARARARARIKGSSPS
jgi:hypothetical protein